MLAVAVRASALPVAIDIGAEITNILAVLREPAINHRRGLVVLRCDDRGVAVGKHIAQLRHRNARQRHSLKQRNEAHRLGRIERTVQQRFFIEFEIDRREHRHTLRQIRPDILKIARQQHRLERRDIRVDRAVQIFG